MRNSWMLAIILGLGLAGPGQAQEEEDGAPPDDMAVAAAVAAQTGRGPVTNLPLPRYVSLKGSEGNARRGPSLSHRIDWVFTHAGMPLRVTAEFGHWRRVEDRDGAGGWVHYSLISGVRTVIVEEELAPTSAFQYFAVLLKDKATGIRDGKREFGHIVVVRCIHSVDAREATAVELPWETLHRICERIVAIKGVNRCLYDLTPKPPATIEYI